MTRPAFGVTETDRMVLNAIERAAEAGRFAPTNAEIAGILGASSMATGARVVAKLEKYGLISVARFAMHRVITIKASGKRTAGATNASRHWREVGAKLPGAYAGRSTERAERNAMEVARPSKAIFVHRDPCFYCGSRGDVGCSHRQPFQAQLFQAPHGLVPASGEHLSQNVLAGRAVGAPTLTDEIERHGGNALDDSGQQLADSNRFVVLHGEAE